MTLEEQLAARKEVVLRKRARKGQRFYGCASIKKELKQQLKAKHKKQSETMLSKNPETIFRAEHRGLSSEEYQIMLDKGISFDDLSTNKDGTVNKNFLPTVTSEDFKNRFRKLKSKHRREGLPKKAEHCTNQQPVTIENPMGAGKPPATVDIKGLRIKASEILETADAVATSGVDFESIPGFYNTKYTPETKLHAITCYIVTGNFREASKLSTVPEITIRKWRQAAAWWPVITKYIQQARQEQIDAQLSGVIHKSVETVADRLENGDYRYNPTLDKLVRVPVQAAQAANIADKAISNRNLLRGDATSRTESSSLAEQIQELKTAFQGFHDHKVIEVIDES